MITKTSIWYEKVANPYDAFQEYENVAYNTAVYYNPDRNIILNSIAKNCSSSLELISPAFGFREMSLYNIQIRSSASKPRVITILRDPVERYKSAVTMLIDQHRKLGLKLSPEQFTNLDYATDMHLIPQTLGVIRNKHIPLVAHIDHKYTYNFQDFELWKDFFKIFDFRDGLETDMQDFYYMYNGVDVVRQVFNDIGIQLPEDLETRINQSYLETVTLSPEMSAYVKQFYEVDYELIKTVNFKNKQD